MVAAAGIGAGDMVIGIQLGLDFRSSFIIAVLMICLVKYVLTEGLARYQLVTGSSVIEAWGAKFPAVVKYMFFAFFLLWSIMVAAALMSACGIAAFSVISVGNVALWGILHALVSFLIVIFGRYRFLEHFSMSLIFLLIVIVVGTAIYQLLGGHTDFSSNYAGDFQHHTLIFAIAGGIGGSVTMLSYGYWIRERDWKSTDVLPKVRLDLRVSYGLTAVFVLALMVISSSADLSHHGGVAMILAMAEVLRETMGPGGDFLFRICFWGVVFSSLVSVWSGVPYLFCDFWNQTFGDNEPPSSSSRRYRYYLGFITLAPMLLTIYIEALENVVHYAVVSAIFVSGLAITLLLLNRKNQLGQWGNGVCTSILLTGSIVLFAVLSMYKFLTLQ